MRQRKSIFVLLSLTLFVFGTFATSEAAPTVQSQALEPIVMVQADTSGWAPPVNLSRSGASAAPQVVIDRDGRHHVLWEDEIDGFVYSAGGIDGWSDPQVVELPFFTRRAFPEIQEQTPTPRFTPRLVADNSGLIHAFWIDTVSDRDGVLRHSSVSARSFAQYDAWAAPQALEVGGIGPTAVVTGSGLHLIYARRLDTRERPAGIYYRRLSSAGGSWGGDRMLYQSRYLRALSADSVNISLTELANGRLVAAWDDVGREMIFFSQSSDNGATWQAPYEIDRRSIDDAPDAIGPSGVAVGRFNTQTVITWSAGHQSGLSCTQYYRILADDGVTWSLPQIVPGLNGCLSSSQFLNANEAILHLVGAVAQPGAQTDVPPSTYLLAWDGERWSDPQLQSDLAGFRNSETNQPLALSCLDVADGPNQLSLVGCDLGVGADIWWTIRLLGDSADWFPPPSSWLGPDTIATFQQPAATVKVIADSVGASHAFWFEDGMSQIFHSRWDGGWSSATPVINSGGGAIEEIAVAEYMGRMFLFYRDNQGLHFAQAAVDQITQWSDAVTLAGVQPDAQYPFILPSRSGELLLAYSVALNEPRGIYLMRSADLGVTWSEPIRIFSGPAAGWQSVGQPQLTETSTGRLHALWSQRALPPEDVQLRMVYSYSDDGGQNWSSPNPVVNTPATWASLQGFGERVVHLQWAEVANERIVLWHSFSADNGATWSERTQVGSLDASDHPTATFDPSGQVHLLGFGNGQLLNWTFDGAGWRAAESFAVNLPGGGPLGADVDTAGRLVAAYAPAMPGASAGQATGGLFGMQRMLNIPAEALPTPPPPQPTATPQPTPEPTSTPEPTPTVVVPTAPDTNPLSAVPGAGNRVGQIALAAIPAALVALLVVALGVRAVRMGRR